MGWGRTGDVRYGPGRSEGFDVRNFKLSMMAAAAIGVSGVITFGGSVPALAATTSGARYEQLGQNAGWAGPGPSGSLNECYLMLLSAVPSDGSPAYVSGLLSNNTSDPCTGFLEDSVSGGAWTEVSPQVTLPATSQGLANYPWVKFANYYAGPGTSVRACVLTPATPGFPSTTKCGSPVTLKDTSKTVPADDSTSLFYAHNEQSAVAVGASDSQCRVFVNSSGSLAKTATSRALMGVEGTATCTAWLETSTDNGQKWQQATPTYSLPFSNPNVDWAFSGPVADGTGKLARACALSSTGNEACTPAW
jgi:hypothetical protein